MTPQQKRSYDAYEYEIRIERVIDMAVEAALTPSTGRLSEVIEDDLIDELVRANRHPSIEPLAEYLLAQGDDNSEVQAQIDEMASERPDLMGVCLQVATPVRHWEEGSGICTYSWGYARLTWVFGATYDEAWAQAVEWAKGQASDD